METIRHAADEPGRDVEYERGEHVEGELDNWIARMDKKRRKEEGERLTEQLYKEPCRKYALKKDRERAAEWVFYLESSATGVLRNAFAIAHKKRQEARKLRERYEIGTRANGNPGDTDPPEAA